jgi:hypothetical protein
VSVTGNEHEWTAWVTPPPLPESPEPVTAATCEICPRLTRLRSGLWEAVPVQVRSDSQQGWETGVRVAAWARPKGAETWTYCALTHLSLCDYRSKVESAHTRTYTAPRWRTSWIVYDPSLVQAVQFERPSTPYWHEQLSLALADVAYWLHHGAQIPLS